MALSFNYLSAFEVDYTASTLEQVAILNFMYFSIPRKWIFKGQLHKELQFITQTLLA